MKIAVAMSGGVDSSAAAAMLKEAGHELIGFTMQLWNQRRGLSVDEDGEPLPSRCCSLDDVYDARRVAEDLGFPFYVLNLEREFERDVVEPFVRSYLEGETPIPCVACNSRLKFASLDRMALSVGCEKVATGHYARVRFDEGARRYRLLRGLDERKDQSYFLWELTQDQLSRALFPLGEKLKADVRGAARRHGLYEAEKLLSYEFTAEGVNWVAFDEPTEPVRAEVRVRYRHEEAPATVTPLEPGRVRIRFDEPQRAVTPGQATVLYRGEEVLGGGWI